MSADSVSSVDAAVLTFHRIAEAFKHSYSLRTQLGDYSVGSDSFKEYVREVYKLNHSKKFSDKCDVICEKLPYGGINIVGPGQTPSVTHDADHGLRRSRLTDTITRAIANIRT